MSINTVTTNIEIPEQIAICAASMLSPYCAGLTPGRLTEALNHDQPTAPADRLLTRHEAVAALRISMPTLDRLLSAGKIQRVKVGRRVFLRESSIREIVEGA
jgi:excisionase family DNA binding protein